METRPIGARLRDLLQGEPLRAISYGAVAVVWLASRAAFELGLAVRQPPAFDAILVAVTSAVALITELGRRWVWSPASVAGLQATQDAPGAPAPAPGASTTAGDG